MFDYRWSEAHMTEANGGDDSFWWWMIKKRIMFKSKDHKSSMLRKQMELMDDLNMESSDWWWIIWNMDDLKMDHFETLDYEKKCHLDRRWCSKYQSQKPWDGATVWKTKAWEGCTRRFHQTWQWKRNHFSVIFLLKPPVIWDFPLSCLITRGWL